MEGDGGVSRCAGARFTILPPALAPSRGRWVAAGYRYLREVGNQNSLLQTDHPTRSAGRRGARVKVLPGSKGTPGLVSCACQTTTWPANPGSGVRNILLQTCRVARRPLPDRRLKGRLAISSVSLPSHLLGTILPYSYLREMSATMKRGGSASPMKRWLFR